VQIVKRFFIVIFGVDNKKNKLTDLYI